MDAASQFMSRACMTIAWFCFITAILNLPETPGFAVLMLALAVTNLMVSVYLED